MRRLQLYKAFDFEQPETFYIDLEQFDLSKSALATMLLQHLCSHASWIKFSVDGWSGCKLQGDKLWLDPPFEGINFCQLLFSEGSQFP
eukprot:740547-Amphidinium_carterae.1